MKNHLLTILATICLATVFSCKNDPPAQPPSPIVLESQKLQQQAGADCTQPDSIRLNCLTLDLSWPMVKDSNEVLKKNVATWANAFLAGMMSLDTMPPNPTVEVAAQSLIQTHQAWAQEAGESVMGNWMVECYDTTLLNNGKHLTLRVNAFNYLGGAHGLTTAAVATFDVASGKQLAWADLVADTTALKILAEQKFREERADVFAPDEEGNPGFAFDEIFQFKLPDNFGLTPEGIYFHYVPYEVAPYAIGATVFTIPYAELGAQYKLGQE